MTKQLRTIGAVSCAKVAAVLYGVVGLIIGAVISLASLLGVFAQNFGAVPDQPGSALFGVLFSVGAIVLLPVIYACMGAIGGLIMAGVYNLVARTVGGIELEIE